MSDQPQGPARVRAKQAQLATQPRQDTVVRDPAAMLAKTLADCAPLVARGEAIWIFAYGSLIWKPEFDFQEARLATANGWHRALQMWSRVNRGTPQCPGLVFALLPGGSCKGMAYRVPAHQVQAVLTGLWPREMVNAVYDPRFVRCRTEEGDIVALAFTLQRSSPSYTGPLSAAQYRQIFSVACGRFGTTWAYAQATHEALQRAGIHDLALARLLALAPTALPASP